MKDSTKVQVGRAIGIDLGDRWSQVCVLDEHGEVMEESRVPTTRKGLLTRFSDVGASRIVIETGTHSNWVHELLSSCGHEVVMANARKLRAISANERKDDRADAEMLARLGRVDPKLLCPVEVRSQDIRRDLTLLRSRAALVSARTQLVNHVRGVTKSMGHRLPKCSTQSIHRQEIPDELQESLGPVLVVLQELTAKIKILNHAIKKLCEEMYPQTALLLQVTGVGPITALCFVLTIGDPGRFRGNRVVGSYVGLTTRRDQSGERDPELRITKCGDTMLRTLLVQSAHYILGPFGPPCTLREFGLRLANRGAKKTKKQAVVATARKLAVLLLALWRSAEVYEPMRGVTVVGTNS